MRRRSESGKNPGGWSETREGARAMGDRGRGRGSPSGARGRCEARRPGRVLRERSQRRGLGLADALHEQGARGRDGREGVREEQERRRKKRRLVDGANERRSGWGWNRKVGRVKARCDQVARREMRARARHGAANGWLSHRRVGPWSEAGRFGAGDVPHRVVDATVTGGPLGGEQPRGKLVVVHGEGSARTTRAIYRRLRTYACLSGRRVTRIRSIRSLARTALEKKREDREGRRRPRWRRVWCGLRENDRALLRLQSLNDDPLVLDVRFDRAVHV